MMVMMQKKRFVPFLEALVLQFDGHSAVFSPPVIHQSREGSTSVVQCIRVTIRPTNPLPERPRCQFVVDTDAAEEIARRA